MTDAEFAAGASGALGFDVPVSAVASAREMFGITKADHSHAGLKQRVAELTTENALLKAQIEELSQRIKAPV